MDDASAKIPEDFVIASGVQHSVRQFIVMSANELGIKLKFEGSGIHEIGIIDKLDNNEIRCKEGDVIIRIDPRYFRPAEVDSLLEILQKLNLNLVGNQKFRLSRCVLK